MKNEPRNDHVAVRGTRWMKKAELVPDFKGEMAEITELEDGKVRIILGRMPAMLFISHDGNGSFDELHLHGEEKIGHRTVTINSAAGELTTFSREQFAAVKTVDAGGNGNG